MTLLLSKAFKELSKLPKSVQAEIASELLGDIESEIKWDKALSESQDKLEKLADKALKDFKAGRTKKTCPRENGDGLRLLKHI